MSTPILTTKLYIPPPRPKAVLRPRLIERLNEGLHRKLTLISAPAGFGKTTLVSEWVVDCGRKVAWLSLDEGDNDITRFLTYLVAVLQTISSNIGKEVAGILQSPQSPSIETILTALLNDISSIPNSFVLIFDDYHVIETKPIDNALAFLLEHLPPQVHLIIATREDPDLPLARFRVREQLTELRATDLRFNRIEAAGFLNQVMGLDLSTEDIASLETRTEGWIAGLQLAAISMQGHKNINAFIKSFTGSHHFVMDYLVEEVLQQQSESVQAFLLKTSILNRMCGPLCDAVIHGTSASGKKTLEYLEHANLFIVPLDNERSWYRYHHLFADLLRQRLHQSANLNMEKDGRGIAELHIRASIWYENNGLEVDAFHHAIAANDVERAERLIEGEGMLLHFRGAVAPVLNWLESLPTSVLNECPSLWTTYASVLLVSGHQAGVEQKLQAAEAALNGIELDDKAKDLVGRVAAIRATLAATQDQVETIIVQSQRALEFLHPDNLSFRTFTTWKLGYAYQLQGDRVAASRAYSEALSISQASGNIITTIVSTIGLGSLQEAENNLQQAAITYQSALDIFGDRPLPFASEAHLGLAQIFYEWNNLNAAQQHGQKGAQLSRQSEKTDRFVACQVFLARLKLAQGDVTGAVDILDKAHQFAHQNDFLYRIPEVVAAQVLTLLHQGNLAKAADLALKYKLSVSQARVLLSRGESSAALVLLKKFRKQVEEKGWKDKRLKIMVLQAVAYHANGEKDIAMQTLNDALTMAEPGGFIRIFIDEGIPMVQVLSEAAARGIKPDYVAKLLTSFEDDKKKSKNKSNQDATPSAQPLIEPLSKRETEILQLIAKGLSNREICEQLFLAMSTVKGHNRNIFDKLQAQRRTEAVAYARKLGLL